jgi:hypothetical protein
MAEQAMVQDVALKYRSDAQDALEGEHHTFGLAQCFYTSSEAIMPQKKQ